MSTKRKIIMPTTAEDAAIAAGIAADPDTYELGLDDLRQMKRRAGRPPSATTKRQVTVRYDADVVDAFKARGPGWQTRMNDALREWLRDHEVG